MTTEIKFTVGFVGCESKHVVISVGGGGQVSSSLAKEGKSGSLYLHGDVRISVREATPQDLVDFGAP